MADDILKSALERFEITEQHDKEQRQKSIEDRRFVHAEDGQWDDDAISKRQDRPRYTINKVAGAIDQVTGDQRQTRVDIKVRPVSGGADEKTADIFNGLIRNIEGQSDAAAAYDNAFDEMVAGGYGGWRILTEYNDDDTFEQDIRIAPIVSADSSLFFDPAATKYDKHDANYAFVVSTMAVEEFKRRWPEATITEWSQVQHNKSNCEGWYSEGMIRVAEYWVKEPVKLKLGLLSDGRVINLEEEQEVLDELAATGVKVVKTRTADSHKVVSYKMSGGEILEGPKPWAGKYIPLVPVYGRTTIIDGKPYIRGMVRFAKDPSRIYNYATSASIEAAALTPKDPIWITETQAKGHEAQLRNFNTRNSPFMLYNTDPTAPGAPQRTGAPAVQAALIQQIQQAGMDIHATTGMEPASLGNSPELKSGKAILAQQAMGDRGTYIFSDNLAKSVEHTGAILVDLIPKIYDTERMVRVLNIDGSSEDAQINVAALDALGQPVVDQQTGKTVMVNDLSLGKYDVVIETGPSYHTQRQESAQQLIDLAQSSPIFEQVAIDLIAKNLNVLENDELTKRIRRVMIKNGTVEPTEEEIEEMGLNQPQQPSASEQALLDSVESQIVLNTSTAINKDADTEKKRAEAAETEAKTLQILVETILEKIEKGIPITPLERSILVKQGDIVREGQQQVMDGPNSEELADIVRMLPQQ
jgi:hypothetical protein